MDHPFGRLKKNHHAFPSSSLQLNMSTIICMIMILLTTRVDPDDQNLMSSNNENDEIMRELECSCEPAGPKQ